MSSDNLEHKHEYTNLESMFDSDSLEITIDIRTGTKDFLVKKIIELNFDLKYEQDELSNLRNLQKLGKGDIVTICQGWDHYLRKFCFKCVKIWQPGHGHRRYWILNLELNTLKIVENNNERECIFDWNEEWVGYYVKLHKE